ncbi:MAG: siphovirus Gp157 family protein [Lachnospiraceae bacterium]|nr:siphovirus Gp157 family protein [Lachnospiraceae bacterium]
MSIYNDVCQIEDAINEILTGDENGNINVDALDTLTGAKTATIASGLETLCKVRANKQAHIAALKAEAQRIVDKARTEEKRLDGLENYILAVFKLSGDKKVTAGTFTVGVRTSQSVYVEPDFNNAEFVRITTTCTPDKIAIRDALKSGREIPGAYLTTKENIAIK